MWYVTHLLPNRDVRNLAWWIHGYGSVAALVKAVRFLTFPANGAILSFARKHSFRGMYLNQSGQHAVTAWSVPYTISSSRFEAFVSIFQHKNALTTLSSTEVLKRDTRKYDLSCRNPMLVFRRVPYYICEFGKSINRLFNNVIKLFQLRRLYCTMSNEVGRNHEWLSVWELSRRRSWSVSKYICTLDLRLHAFPKTGRKLEDRTSSPL
jgi:hypothetical protein